MDQLLRYNLCRLVANCVHPPNPLHLIGSFQLLCHSIASLQLVYQLVKHLGCRPVDFLQMVSQLAIKEQRRI